MSDVQFISKEIGCESTARHSPAPLTIFIALNVCLSLVVFLSFVLSVDDWSIPDILISALVLVNAIWISGGAATAILGLFSPPQHPAARPAGWQPNGRTAILIATCGEAPEPLAAYLSGFTKSLSRAGLQTATEVFVISDTFGGHKIAAEQKALAPLIATGVITYRRRSENTDKKPGNIADWLTRHGHRFDYMVVKDADSRMTESSIKEMIWRMETRPRTGLLQAGIALIPGRTRFGRHQRIASRLMSRNFGRGFAAWSGKTANYWGHNAIMRVAAFRNAASLPRLSGSAPFGGAILSHDFVEAAWMRRAGWDIEVAPDIHGSAEDAPQTLTEFFSRDRRWCQGNLQHVRIVGQRGLHGLSRFHFITGIFSYIAAPIWLLLVACLSAGVVSVSGFAPVLLVVAVLLAPKICALIDLMPQARTWPRRAIILKAWFYELIVSTLVAPLIMLRQAISVGTVLLGRDCGWKSHHRSKPPVRPGWTEGAIGLFILAVAGTSGIAGAPWLAAVFLPLLSAPLLVPFLNRNP